MKDFSTTIKILTEQVTPFERLRASTLLKFFQEISIAHTESLGMTKDKTLDRGLLWVVGKQEIDITRMPRYDETVEVSTFPSKTMFTVFPRMCFIHDLKGNLLVSCSAMWALIDKKTRKIIEPDKKGIYIPDLSYGREQFFPLSIVPKSLDKRTEIEAKFSECDLNGHLNNTSYLDIAEDLIPVSYLKNHGLKKIKLDYKKEVPLGEKLPLDYGNESDTYYFKSAAFLIELGFQRSAPQSVTTF